MANNSIPNETKVRWYDENRIKWLEMNGSPTRVSTGKVVAQSRQGEECVIVEWDAQDFPVSIENVDDLIEIK